MAVMGADGRWYTDDGIPIDQAAEGDPSSYLPGYQPDSGYVSPITEEPAISSYPDYLAGYVPPNEPPPQQIGGGMIDGAAAYGERSADDPPMDDGGGGAVPGTTEYPIAGGKQFFQYADWTPPNENFEAFDPAKYGVSVNYPAFAAPSAADAENYPGYAFSRDEMMRGIKNDRSSRGLLATGGTLHDLASMINGLSQQNYGNVWNQQFQGYNTNRDNAAQGFTRGLTTYLTNEKGKADDWTRDLTRYSTNLNKEASTYGLNLDTSKLNLARDNSQFGNLYQLANLYTSSLPGYTPTVN